MFAHEGDLRRAARWILLWTSVAHLLGACRAKEGDDRGLVEQLGRQPDRDPQAVETPRDVEEVSLLVKRAATNGQRVKPVGSGHSFTATALTDGIAVASTTSRGLREIDRATRRVTVRAGTPAAPSSTGCWRATGSRWPTSATSTGRRSPARRRRHARHRRALGGLADADRRPRARGSATAPSSTCSADERPELFAAARVGHRRTRHRHRGDPAVRAGLHAGRRRAADAGRRGDAALRRVRRRQRPLRVLLVPAHRPRAGQAQQPAARRRAGATAEQMAGLDRGRAHGQRGVRPDLPAGKARPSMVPRPQPATASMLSARDASPHRPTTSSSPRAGCASSRWSTPCRARTRRRRSRRSAT